MLVYISQYQAYVGVYFIAAEGVDKGTTNYSNGVTAARLLLEAEKLKGDCQPFSWVLFRPPWSPNCTCCKACIWHQLRRHSNETVSALQNSEHECTSFLMDIEVQLAPLAMLQGTLFLCIHSARSALLVHLHALLGEGEATKCVVSRHGFCVV